MINTDFIRIRTKCVNAKVLLIGDPLHNEHIENIKWCEQEMKHSIFDYIFQWKELPTIGTKFELNENKNGTIESIAGNDINQSNYFFTFLIEE